MSRAIVQILLVSKVYMVDFRGSSTVHIANSRFSLSLFFFSLQTYVANRYIFFFFVYLVLWMFVFTHNFWTAETGFILLEANFRSRAVLRRPRHTSKNLFHTVEIYKNKNDKFTTHNFNKFYFCDIFFSCTLKQRDTHTHSEHTFISLLIYLIFFTKMAPYK